MPIAESHLNPTTRSHTALFRVLASMMAGMTRVSSKRVIYPVNQPGQNVLECYTLAGLVFMMLTCYFTSLLGDFFGACVSSYLLGFLIALGLTFVILHVLLIVFSLVYHLLKSIQFFPPSAPQQVPMAVYLFAFTLFALALLYSGKVVWMLIAMPWLLGVALSALCALALFLRNFISQLQGGENES